MMTVKAFIKMERSDMLAILAHRVDIYDSLNGENVLLPFRMTTDNGIIVHACKPVGGRATKSLSIAGYFYELWLSLPQVKNLLERCKEWPMFKAKVVDSSPPGVKLRKSKSSTGEDASSASKPESSDSSSDSDSDGSSNGNSDEDESSEKDSETKENDSEGSSSDDSSSDSQEEAQTM